MGDSTSQCSATLPFAIRKGRSSPWEGSVRASTTERTKFALCHIETGGVNERCSGLNVSRVPRFHSLDAVAEALSLLCMIISQEFADPIVMS